MITTANKNLFDKCIASECAQSESGFYTYYNLGELVRAVGETELSDNLFAALRDSWSALIKNGVVYAPCGMNSMFIANYDAVMLHVAGLELTN